MKMLKMGRDVAHSFNCTPAFVDMCLIQSVSVIHLVCRCASLSTTFALSQSMTWWPGTGINVAVS